MISEVSQSINTMPLAIKFKVKREDDLIYNRFQSAIKLFGFLKEIVYKKGIIINEASIKIAFFLDYPIKEVYSKLSFTPYKFGILNSYRKDIQALKSYEKSRAGFIINGVFSIPKIKKEINFNYILNPEKYCRKEAFDIKLDINPNRFVKEFYDLEQHLSNFRNEILKTIKLYEEKREKNDLIIRKVIIFEDIHEDNIKRWNFIYLRYPQEIVIELYRYLLDKEKNIEVKNRMDLINESKISAKLINKPQFLLAISKIAKESNVALSSSSLVFIPDNKQGMENLVNKINKTILIPTIKLFEPEEKIEKGINNILYAI